MRHETIQMPGLKMTARLKARYLLEAKRALKDARKAEDWQRLWRIGRLIVGIKRNAIRV